MIKLQKNINAIYITSALFKVVEKRIRLPAHDSKQVFEISMLKMFRSLIVLMIGVSTTSSSENDRKSLIIEDPPKEETHDDADKLTELEFRKYKFTENVHDYYNGISLIGITAAEAAVRVQVLAALAELANRCLEHLDKIHAMKTDVVAKIAITLTALEKEVTHNMNLGTSNGYGLQASASIGGKSEEKKLSIPVEGDQISDPQQSWALIPYAGKPNNL